MECDGKQPQWGKPLKGHYSDIFMKNYVCYASSNKNVGEDVHFHVILMKCLCQPLGCLETSLMTRVLLSLVEGRVQENYYHK